MIYLRNDDHLIPYNYEERIKNLNIISLFEMKY